MSEQRRHRRIRFGQPPTVVLGQRGRIGQGELHNLSLGGLMLRTPLPLAVGETFGCEFSVFGSPRIDMAAVVVNRIGDLYSARFQPGPLSEIVIHDAIECALAGGEASVLSIHDVNGGKLMRVAGGLNAALASDFIHGLAQVGVRAIDLSAVTAIDEGGLALCRLAVDKYQLMPAPLSPCVEAAWQQVCS